jgi:DNA polymerase-1
MDPRIEQLPFAELWAFDFEFRGGESGNHYQVVCLVARELRTGLTIRLWENEFESQPPYRIDEQALFICFAAHAECGCHLSLGWPLPARVLDLSPEFRNVTNGRTGSRKRGLVDALERYGIPTLGQLTKDAWRDRVIAGPPWTAAERQGIITYCQSDVDALEPLLARMLPAIDLPRALLRSEFVSRPSTMMEWRGVPLDMEIFSQLRDQSVWNRIREELIPAVDHGYGVYDGRTFKEDRFNAYLARHGIPWPRLDTGELDLKESTFRAQAKTYPTIAPLHELRHTLAKLRRIELQVGDDGRNRTVLWPFTAKTSRTQPKARNYIFSPSVWLRSLIRPEPDMAVAYLDYSAMEFGIAAALSGDQRMIEAYNSGDPYLDFATSFGAAPPGATKRTHAEVRELYKVMLLATQYGMESASLAMRLGVSRIEAGEMLQHHRLLFARYWTWSDQWLYRALSTGQMRTAYGWTYYLETETKERTIRNWPVQSHGAEILRIGCILAEKHGIALLAPIHDAVLIEAPADHIDADVARAQDVLQRASRIVLNPKDRRHDLFTLRTDATIVRHPDRYVDKRGIRMWTIVNQQLEAMKMQGIQRDAAQG